MNILNTFIEQASNIWLGIVSAIAIVAILYFVIYTIMAGRKTFSPLCYLVAVPLLPMLAFQLYLLFGAVSVKHKCNEIAVWIDAFVPQQSIGTDLHNDDIEEIIQEALSIFPFASQFIDSDFITESRESSLGKAITHKANSYLNKFIIRRVAWSLGFIVTASFFILFFAQNNSYELGDMEGVEDLDNMGIIC